MRTIDEMRIEREAKGAARVAAAAFRAALGSSAAPPQTENDVLRAQVQACHEQNAILATALDRVHSWFVCACIASADDMAQSFPDMEALCREALEATNSFVSDRQGK